MLFLFTTFKKESLPTPAQKVKSKPSSKFAFKRKTLLNANKTKVFKAEAKRNIQNAPKLNTLKKTETEAETETEAQSEAKTQAQTEAQPESLQTGAGALLHYAVENYLQESKEIYLNTIDELLEQGVDVNEKNKHGFPIFHSVGLSGDADLIQKFLDHGVDVNGKSKRGGTALELAIISGNLEAIKLILNNGGVAKNAIRTALLAEHLDVAEFLIKEGADVNESDIIGSPLMFAVSYSPKIVKLLIDHGADVNFKSKLTTTSLMLAAREGNLETVKTLVNHGAKLNTRDGENFTALYHAMEKDNIDVIKFLIKKGAE